MNLPYAEDVNFWKSSKSNSDTWLDRTEDLITKYDGVILVRAKGMNNGESAFLVEFKHKKSIFKIVWPILPTKQNEIRAAERQAATLIYHDVKARILRSHIFGFENAFFDFMLLPNGKTVSQMSTVELQDIEPKLLMNNG